MISGCLVKERRRGREGRRDGSEVEGKLLVSFLSFPGRSDWTTRAHAPSTTIEQLLVRRFQNLITGNNTHTKKKGQKRTPPTVTQFSNISSSCAHLEWTHECLIYTHHCTSIVKFSAVVWGWKQRHQLPLCKELIAVLNHLKTNMKWLARCLGRIKNL